MPSSMNMGTTTGARALHLAVAEPMKRSRPEEKPRTPRSRAGAGRFRVSSV
jgi:hypothetical protein